MRTQRFLALVAFFLTAFSILAAQIVPYGLQGLKISSLSISEAAAGYSHLLIAAAEEGGVYGREVDLADSNWFSLGLVNKAISSVFVQTVGAGPLDYYLIYAATKPDSIDMGLVYKKDFRINTTEWLAIDSGLFINDKQYIDNLCGFHFSGHEPPAPIFGHAGSTIYRTYAFNNSSWDSIAGYSQLYTLKSFGLATLWGGGSNGYSAPFLIRSPDTGTTWEYILPELADHGGENTCFSVAVDPQHPDTVYAGLRNHVIKSVDGGKSWQVTGLKDTKVIFYALALNAMQPNHLMAGGADESNKPALFESFDGAETWQVVSDISPQPSPMTLMTSMVGQGIGDNFVFFIGTYGNGMYIREYPLTAVEKPDSDQRPDKFLLRQNYPNPFNSSTIITFELPLDAFVDITVYNLAGQKVTTLLSEKMKTGKQEITWNAESVSSGIYIIRLSSDVFNHSIKSILIK